MQPSNLDLLHVNLPHHDEICSRVERWERACESLPRAISCGLYMAFAAFSTVATEIFLRQSNVIQLPESVSFSQLGFLPFALMPTVVVMQMLYVRPVPRETVLRVAPVMTGVLCTFALVMGAANYLLQDIPLMSSLMTFVLAMGAPVLGGIALKPVFSKLGKWVGKAIMGPLGALRTRSLGKKFPQWGSAVRFKSDGNCVGDLSGAPLVLSPSHRGNDTHNVALKEYQARRLTLSFTDSVAP